MSKPRKSTPKAAAKGNPDPQADTDPAATPRVFTAADVAQLEKELAVLNTPRGLLALGWERWPLAHQKKIYLEERTRALRLYEADPRLPPVPRRCDDPSDGISDLCQWYIEAKAAAAAEAQAPAKPQADKPGMDATAAAAEAQADDGRPFYRPAYFKRWNIGDDHLRKNAIDKGEYIEGKVRRDPKNPASGKGKRPVYWYSEPDARKRWPDKFLPVVN